MSVAERPAVTVADLAAEARPEAIEVLARGMRDNPLHVAAFGTDPDRRVRSTARLFTAMFEVLGADMRALGARLDGTLVGVGGDIAPSGCRLGFAQQLRMLPAVTGLGPGAALRVLRWVGTWRRHDPDRPHSHFGPFAVDLGLQGRGIGSQVLEAYCARLDSRREDAYLETDKPENVRLYERFGFRVTDEAVVIGVANWFMWRPPRG